MISYGLFQPHEAARNARWLLGIAGLVAGSANHRACDAKAMLQCTVEFTARVDARAQM
jgi:hypothetical protein